MEIVQRLISELKSHEKNARTHSEEQIEQLMNSMVNFGHNDPIEIGVDNVIISGHARLEAAKRLGYESVPVIIHKHLEGNKREAYILAANKIAMNAAWDLNLLQECLSDLNEEEQLLTGFNEEELTKLLPFEEYSDHPIDEDECPEVSIETRVKPGDIWILGDHRLMCGDSTVSTDVERLLEDEHPALMITDPPYGVNLDMSWRDEAKPDNSINNKNTIKNDDNADWYDAYILFPGNIAYVWHASAFTDIVMQGLRQANFNVRQQIIWVKSHLVLGRSNYHWQHEPCWYAIKEGTTSNWKGDRKQTTIWEANAPAHSAGVRIEDKTAHPTQKPVELYLRPINNHTLYNDCVYDPFAGSGTLIIACEKTKRKALCMELDPFYCDVIIKRYEHFTGKTARKA